MPEILRYTLQAERTASAKALGQEQITHLQGSYWTIIKEINFFYWNDVRFIKNYKNKVPYAFQPASLDVNILHNHGTFVKTKNCEL